MGANLVGDWKGNAWKGKNIQVEGGEGRKDQYFKLDVDITDYDFRMKCRLLLLFLLRFFGVQGWMWKRLPRNRRKLTSFKCWSTASYTATLTLVSRRPHVFYYTNPAYIPPQWSRHLCFTLWIQHLLKLKQIELPPKSLSWRCRDVMPCNAIPIVPPVVQYNWLAMSEKNWS